MFIVIAVKAPNHTHPHKAYSFTIFFCVCPRKKERVNSEGDANLASFVKLKISQWFWAEHCRLGFLGVVHCRVCQFLYSFCCGNTQCVRNEEVTCKFMTFDRRTRVIGKPMVHTIVRRIILLGMHFLIIIRVSDWLFKKCAIRWLRTYTGDVFDANFAR